jgi:predicted permease
MNMPDWAEDVRPRLSPLRLSPTRENEIVEELSQHLEDRWRELLAGGASEDEARRLALAEFHDGNLLATFMGPLRQARTPPPLTPGVPAGHAFSDLRQDLRYAWQLSWRRPGFTGVAALTLALGIGANSAIFSLVDAVLLRTLPVSQPEQLVLIEQVAVRGGTQNLSRPLFEELREERTVFSGVAAAQDGLTPVRIGELAPDTAAAQSSAGPANASGDAADTFQTASVQAVSGEYFQVLGTSAVIGRTFTAADDRAPGAHPVAVLSHAFWTRRMGADPEIIGRTLSLARQRFTIVGVTRRDFFGEAVGRAPDIWVPMMMHPGLNPGPSLLADPRTGWLMAIGRLRPGVTRQQAEAALTLLLDRLKADRARLGGMPRHIGKLRVADGSQGLNRLREQFSLPLRILAAAVGVVLLIACANVATLLLARASTRQREIAIRLAIGADRRRIVQQLMTESLLLGAIAGSLGLLLAWWGSPLLVMMAGAQGQRIDIDVTPDLPLLAFNMVVSFGAVILFGLAPALSASHADMNAAMKQTPGLRSRWRLSPTLVVTQVALSLLLLVGAALFRQTLHNLRTRDLGFAAEALVQVRTQPEASGYTPEHLPGLAQRIVERLATTPGVRAVSVADSGFATGTSSTCCIAIPGRVFASDREREMRTIGVGPGYFATVGQRLRIGRDFTPPDASAASSGSTAVAIVNDAFVRRFLAEGNPIGQSFGWGDPPRVRYGIEVIGVVNDAIYDEVRGVRLPLIYFPSESGRVYMVRAAGAPEELVGSLRRQIQGIDPKLIVTVIAPVVQDVERALVRERLLAWLSGCFGALAVTLAAIGLYGLMAYAVANRTREIGIRMALGAPRGRVLATEILSALRLVALGIAIGIPAAIAGGRMIAAQLFGVSASDLVTLAGAAGLMTLIAGFAAYGPARRASRVDLMLALRNP